MDMDGLYVHWCGEIVGTFTEDDCEMGVPADLVGREQRCGCDRDDDCEVHWSGYDFDVALELCRCCAAIPIPSGSRWSVYFCEDCLAAVRALNDTAGAVVVPIGRHSSLHGILVSDGIPADEHEAAIARIAAFLGSCRHGLLEDWRNLRVERVLEEAAGPDEEGMRLADYLRAACVHLPDRSRLAAELGDWLDTRERELLGRRADG